MAYGYRKYRGKRYASRTAGRSRTRARSTYKKVGRRFVRAPKFAVVSYARDVEKKYRDFCRQFTSVEANVGYVNPAPGSNNFNNGVMYTNLGTYAYEASKSETGTPINTQGNLLTPLSQGTNVNTRIGNKISVKYIKGTINFGAVVTYTTSGTLQTQGGEQLVTQGTEQSAYLRTTIRWALVKDTQHNNASQACRWDDVFRSGESVYGTNNGVFSELNVDNMGRYIILQDKMLTLDADDPQRTIRFKIDGSKIGNVRYNGPDNTAYTDKGIYFIYSAFCAGSNSVTFGTLANLPNPVVQSRLCFTDA